MSPNAWESRGLSQGAQLYKGAQLDVGDLTPYSTYGKMDWIGSIAVSVTLTRVLHNQQSSNAFTKASNPPKTESTNATRPNSS